MGQPRDSDRKFALPKNKVRHVYDVQVKFWFVLGLL